MGQKNSSKLAERFAIDNIPLSRPVNDVSDSLKSTQTPSGYLDYSASLMVCNDFHDRDEIC